MLRNILSIVIGTILGIIVIQIIQILGHLINPPPADLDITNVEAINAYIASAPAIVFVLVIVSYAIGSFVGAFTSIFVSKEKHMSHAINIGGILMGLGAINLFTIPHPIWMIIVSLLVFLPSAYLGARVGIKVKMKNIKKDS
ncbi:MAG: hypothetical protein JNL69_10180 [Bacteroidia bacterium]|nr:hypothetical protein [Bacteroidia bacterium]